MEIAGIELARTQALQHFFLHFSIARVMRIIE